MPDGAGTSYTPQVYKIGRDKGPRFQQPVLSTVLEYLRLGTFQLVTVGGSAALAKTLVAPLERIKVPAPPSNVQWKPEQGALLTATPVSRSPCLDGPPNMTCGARCTWGSRYTAGIGT